MTRPVDDALAALAKALDDGVLLAGDRIPAKARSDASLSGRDLPVAYIRPTDIDQISATLRICPPSHHVQPTSRAISALSSANVIAASRSPDR